MLECCVWGEVCIWDMCESTHLFLIITKYFKARFAVATSFKSTFEFDRKAISKANNISNLHENQAWRKGVTI